MLFLVQVQSCWFLRIGGFVVGVCWLVVGDVGSVGWCVVGYGYYLIGLGQGQVVVYGLYVLWGVGQYGGMFFGCGVGGWFFQVYDVLGCCYCDVCGVQCWVGCQCGFDLGVDGGVVECGVDVVYCVV